MTTPGSDSAPRSGNRWTDLTGGLEGTAYAARFARLSASGADVHGEATLCASLTPPGSRILDAGCGTGRVAVRLSELGYRCVGVDADASMLAVAQASAAAVRWVLGDLADLSAVATELGAGYDLAVAAGNVVPLLSEGTERGVVRGLAARLRPRGLLVAGFGLDVAHLPLDFAPVDLPSYDRWCADAGLVLAHRFATWDGEPFDDGGYAVSIHRRR